MKKLIALILVALMALASVSALAEGKLVSTIPTRRSGPTRSSRALRRNTAWTWSWSPWAPASA